MMKPGASFKRASSANRAHLNSPLKGKLILFSTCGPFSMKNVHVVKQLLLGGTRSVLYHLSYEKMSKIIAIAT